MKLTKAQHEALWEFLSGPQADEATTAAQVYPAAVIGPAVTPPAIVKRAWPALAGERKRKRKKKKIPMEAIFPRSTAK